MLRKIEKYIKGVMEPDESKEVKMAEKEQTKGADAKKMDIAAIAMALHLYFDDQHEVEQTGFWLNRPLNYQPAWAAKSILFKKSPIRKQ